MFFVLRITHAIAHVVIKHALRAIVVESPGRYLGALAVVYIVLPTIPARVPLEMFSIEAMFIFADPMTLFWPKIRMAALFAWHAAIAR